jgi:hypothetical protein
MRPVDKAGRPIFPWVFAILQEHGARLDQLGYNECRDTPNLFLLECARVTFYADMRGTKYAPVWSRRYPGFYWRWMTPVPPVHERQRTVAIEWLRLSDKVPLWLLGGLGDGDGRGDADLAYRLDVCLTCHVNPAAYNSPLFDGGL